MDLPMPVALELARNAVFVRAVEVSFSPELLAIDTYTDIRKPQCRRLTAKRVGCTYRFTVEVEGATMHDERGEARITRRKQQATPTAILGATRNQHAPTGGTGSP